MSIATAVIGTGFGLIVGQAVGIEHLSQLRAPGGWEIFLGSLTGLAGTYLALVMVLLVSRVPIVERVLGHDGLIRLHRRVAPLPISLLTAHAILLTAGYAVAAHTGFLSELHSLVFTFPGVLLATMALGLMLGIGVASIGAVRRRIPRERWWALHLTIYIALAISFTHTVAIGPSFVGHPLVQSLWVLLWLATAGTVICFRFGLPIVRTVRHRLRVVEVRELGPGTFSIVLRGRGIQHLAVSGGQFFEWRFLTRGMWWQAHPFSLSALPKPPFLRLTVKEAGDFTRALRHIALGTRVAIEGPYGVFTNHSRRRRGALLIAGGIGVTAVRALLEDLPAESQPIIVLRVTRPEELALASEVHELARRKNGRVHELVGARRDVPLAPFLRGVPDIDHRDVFIAGPESFVAHVVNVARSVGVRDSALHFEAYAL